MFEGTPVQTVVYKMLFAVFLTISLLTSLTSANYTDVGEEINETIICTKDLIEVEIPSKFFLTKNPPIQISDLHLNDPECHGTKTGSFYVFSIKTSFTDCGTRMASDGVHIVFSNTIQSNFSDIITRSFINSTFACRYPINYMVQQPNGENKISVDISCPHIVKDETLSVIMNGEGAEAMFRIQMFKFVGISYKDVFLHCAVQICHNSAAVCKPNYTNYGKITRNKRETILFLTHTVSYGPIKRKLADDGETNKGRGEFTPVETWILGEVLMAFLVITGVFRTLLLQSRRAYLPMQPQLIMSHFHNSEAAS